MRVLVVLAFAFVLRAEWLRLQSPHFELFSSAGAGAGREALRRLEQARVVFQSRVGHAELSPLPVRVFVFGYAGEFRRFRVTENSSGYYQSGGDRDYIAMVAERPDSYRIVLHEYVHLAMRHTGLVLPAWLNEGTAEVFSTLRLAGTEAHIGEPIASHLQTLRLSGMMDLADLLAAAPDSFDDRLRTGVFYAQSWALTHMLHFSDQYSKGTPDLIASLSNGRTATEAFRSAYGRTVEQIESDLQTYVGRDRFAGARFETVKPPDLGPLPATQVGFVESRLLLIDLLLAIRNTEDADHMLRALAADYPERADLQEALGDAALRRGEEAVARTHYERAIEMGSRSGRLRYDYALVRLELGATDAEFEKLLREAADLDPMLFDVRYRLGTRALSAGRFAEAVTHLEAAAALRPSFSPAWEDLARAHRETGNMDAARSAGYRARSLAREPEDIARTEALLRLAEPVKPAAAPVARRVLPRVEGTLIQVDCIDGAARLHIRHESGKTLLLVRDPGQVTLKNAGGESTEFACGQMERKVAVEYKASPDARWGTSGEVWSIEFR